MAVFAVGVGVELGAADVELVADAVTVTSGEAVLLPPQPARAGMSANAASVKATFRFRRLLANLAPPWRQL
ncbi:hypothetical protein C0Z11_08450 [Acidipropionibacterium jensenii]|nr:hypothetical protein C0Z11_08450 [Acidipropionibacterium jensenii]